MSKDRTQAIPAFIDLAAQRERMGDRLDSAVSAVLKHGQFILGPQVIELERELAAFCGARHASLARTAPMHCCWPDGRRRGPGRRRFRAGFHLCRNGRGAGAMGATPVFVDIAPIRSTSTSRASKPRSARPRHAASNAPLRHPCRSLRPAGRLRRDPRGRQGAQPARSGGCGTELRREPRWQEGRHARALYGRRASIRRSRSAAMVTAARSSSTMRRGRSCSSRSGAMARRPTDRKALISD